MLGPAVSAIKDYVAANFTTWPVRWQNENFTLPVDGSGNALPYVEIEIIGGRNAIRAFSTPGNRVFVHPGLIRFYLCAPRGTGADGAVATADILAALFERKEFGQSGGRTVKTGDFSTWDDVASHEDGNYFVLLASVPFDFYYTN